MTEAETATQPTDVSEGPVHGPGTVLAFLNEVAGGRKLLTAARELSDAGASYFAVVAA